MSKFDGSSEKQNDGGDSAAFRGRRHPFLERRIDWKKIDRARYSGEVGDSSAADKIARPSEIPEFELTGFSDPRDERVERCVSAVKQLGTNSEQWYVIRECLLQEYKSAGPKKKNSQRALSSFIATVNKRLGASGEIYADRLIGLLARNVADADGVAKPELSMHVTVRHQTGQMGPIGIAFPK